ncbi:MAG: hypothetical protein F4X66_11725 [Chloroflexi bacterium]|nr:hypothetical protein [Chloroflexota bacterium]MYE39856.1 hypothetical protein [Chloroflexota bacterium]
MPDTPEEHPENPKDQQEQQREGRESLAGYVVSLPERLVRTTAASGGGLLLEAADHILPPPVRDAKIYQCLIARPLRITVEAVGGVSGRFPMQDMSGQELIQRKVAGNFVEAFSVFTVGFSPLWFLAVASDVTGGTRVYLDAFVRELKKADILPDNTDVSSVDDLLAVLDRTVGQAADTIDIPPTAISDMRDSVDLLRENAELIPGPQRLAELFSQLNEAAREQKRSPLVVSTLVAAGALQAGIQLGSVHIVSFYAEALSTIRTEGVSQYLGRISQPYVDAATSHLKRGRRTHTGRMVRRVLDNVPTSGPDANNWTELR